MEIVRCGFQINLKLFLLKMSFHIESFVSYLFNLESKQPLTENLSAVCRWLRCW